MTKSVYFRMYPGGTRPDNVTDLIDGLTTLLEGNHPRHSSRIYSDVRGDESAMRPVMVPIAPDADPKRVKDILHQRVSDPLAPTVDVIMQTSGSTTGRGHLVGLSTSALRASAEATLSYLGGAGRWILALPIHHIAGFQVLVRSLVSDVRPVIVDTTAGFKTDALTRAINRAVRMENKRADKEGDLPDYRRYPLYTSLVPTQLRKVLEDPDATQALAQVDKVLVGGAPSTDNLLQVAHDAGITVVTTYGMTETCGGCVYDGMPLSGIQVATIDNLIWLSGTTLMETYVDDPSAANFVVEGHRRWFKTSDAGHMEGPRLVVDGRVDDVINTGGVKIQASLVEEVLLDMPEVANACVVGVPDPRWGQLVTAVFEPSDQVDPDLLQPLADICELQPKTPQQRDADEEPQVGSVTSHDVDVDYASLTPLEAAMAAMAAKIRGEDVDVVKAAKTGKVPENIYQIVQNIEPDEPFDDAAFAEGDDTPDTDTNDVFDTGDVDKDAAQGSDTAGDATDQSGEGRDGDEGEASADDAQADEPSVDQDTLAVYLRGRVSRDLDRAHAPRAIIVTDDLPMLASGKVDRHEIQRLATIAVHNRKAWLR